MNKLLIVDLDDTTYPNAHYYVSPIVNLLDYIVNKINPPNKRNCLKQIKKIKAKMKKRGHLANSVDDLLDEVDAEPILRRIVDKQAEKDEDLINEFKKQKKGFCVARFPYSFILTLRDLYQGSSFSDESKVYTIGEQFMNIEPGLYKGVAETLDFLLQQNNSLVLLTKGEYDFQNKKIQINNLRKWFKEINIVPDDKTPELFKKLAKGYNPDSVYSVGDSIKSDINPALKAGYKAIHIPQHTWAFEAGEDLIYPERTLILKSFKDIMLNYSRL